MALIKIAVWNMGKKVFSSAGKRLARAKAKMKKILAENKEMKRAAITTEKEMAENAFSSHVKNLANENENAARKRKYHLATAGLGGLGAGSIGTALYINKKKGSYVDYKNRI